MGLNPLVEIHNIVWRALVVTQYLLEVPLKRIDLHGTLIRVRVRDATLMNPDWG